MPADGVAHPITLNWGTGSGSNANFGHRSRTSSARTRRARAATLSSTSPSRRSARGPTRSTLGSHTLSVTIGIVSSLQQNSTDPAAPASALKVVGSQNQAIDCDPAARPNLRTSSQTGARRLTRSTRAPRASRTQYYATLPQTAPWACTRTQTGGSVGQVYQGMLDRRRAGQLLRQPDQLEGRQRRRAGDDPGRHPAG